MFENSFFRRENPVAGLITYPAARSPGAAVDRNDRAGDVAGGRRGEEADQLAAFVLNAAPAERNAFSDRAFGLLLFLRWLYSTSFGLAINAIRDDEEGFGVLVGGRLGRRLAWRRLGWTRILWRRL